ncbi:S1C family serine protease [Acidipila rosea]|nr:trypsin-like peptidase domain-containing protein [Acidipila rosea]MBW4026360.1 trypsin-like serine protease [Acidobacteriota bacterium]MBW4044504.1 trypsin-like serine protease [Acidobacteriota bacterium]
MKIRNFILAVLLAAGVGYFVAWKGQPHREGAHSPLTLTEAHAAPEYDTEELDNIAVYKKVLPSVVNITSTTVTLDFFYGPVPQRGQGSGFVLDKQGHILTNYHVIADAQNIQVTTSDKRNYKARVIGKDQRHDLALLQIDGAADLVPAVLAQSHNLVVGQKVYAIGNPFGLSGTMTTGIISAIRSIRGPQGAPIENAIQTDAAINPGNSGGPLLNSRGEVIGINSLIATNPNENVEQSAGIGFAIPIDTAKAVLGDFQRYGHARRPSLGITSLSIGPDLAQQMGLAADYGVLIQRVVPGGAAERAGLHGGTQAAYLGNLQILLGGDFIIAIDGQQIASTEDINQVMDLHQVGDTVTVTFLRGHRKLTARVTLGDAHDLSA